MYLFREGGPARKGRGERQPRVQLLGSGTILREVIAGADLLAQDFGVAADMWSAPSFTELRRDGLAAERWNMLHPTEPPRRAYVDQLPGRPAGAGGRRHRLHQGVRRPDPAVRARHATRCSAPTASAAPTTAASCAGSSRSTGTSSPWPRCSALAQEGTVPAETVAKAIEKYGIDPEKPDPARS